MPSADTYPNSLQHTPSNKHSIWIFFWSSHVTQHRQNIPVFQTNTFGNSRPMNSAFQMPLTFASNFETTSTSGPLGGGVIVLPFTFASSLETASGPLGGGVTVLPLTASFSRPLNFGLSGLGARTNNGLLGRERTNCVTSVSLFSYIDTFEIRYTIYTRRGRKHTELAALKRAIKLACTTSSWIPTPQIFSFFPATVHSM